MISPNITIIQSYSFSGLPITHLTIPNTVQKVEKHAFQCCPTLQVITFDPSSTTIDNTEFNENITKFNISSSTEIIPKYSLSHFQHVREIIIPSSVKIIESESFTGCSSLQRINIPSSISSVGEFAFSGCSDLDESIIQQLKTRFGDNIFQRVNKITFTSNENEIQQEIITLRVIVEPKEAMQKVEWHIEEEESNTIKILRQVFLSIVFKPLKYFKKLTITAIAKDGSGQIATKELNIGIEGSIEVNISSSDQSIQGVIKLTEHFRQIDHNRSKYLLNTENTPTLGSEAYNNPSSIENLNQQFTFYCKQGTYYVHALIIDNYGIKSEIVSDGVTTNGFLCTFQYKGSVQSVSLLPGTYKLECWGAEGGNSEYHSKPGGKGGYSV